MSATPAFQFYPDDFLGSAKVGQMSNAEIGVFVRLLCYEWNDGGLPTDIKILARMAHESITKFRTMWKIISLCFVERDGRLFNPRLDKERDKQMRWREKSSQGGKKSGEVRAKGGSRVVEPPTQPPTQPKGNTPVSSLQSPSLVTTPIATRMAADAAVREEPDPIAREFEGLWAEYPPRPNNPKARALHAYRARRRKGVSHSEIAAGLGRYKRHCEARDMVGTEFVMQAATFFGPDQRWTEEWHSTGPPARAPTPRYNAGEATFQNALVATGLALPLEPPR